MYMYMYIHTKIHPITSPNFSTGLSQIFKAPVINKTGKSIHCYPAKACIKPMTIGTLPGHSYNQAVQPSLDTT